MHHRFNEKKPFRFSVCVGNSADYRLYVGFLNALKAAHMLSDQFGCTTTIFESKEIFGTWFSLPSFTFTNGKLSFHKVAPEISVTSFLEKGSWLNKKEYKKEMEQVFREPMFFGRYVV